MGQMIVKSPNTGNIFNILAAHVVDDLNFRDAVMFYDQTFKLIDTGYKEFNYSQQDLEQLSSMISLLVYGGEI